MDKQKIIGEIYSYVCNRMSYDTLIRTRYFLMPSFRKAVRRGSKEYKDNISRINARSKKEKVTIVFLCQMPSLWNGVRSIYEAAQADARVNVFCVSVPDKKIGEGFDVSADSFEEDISYDFLKNLGCEVVQGYAHGEWLDLRELQPDYVFLQRPYDYYLPECYQSHEVAKFAKVCYVPYGYDISMWDSKYSYAIDFMTQVYLNFVENQYYKDEMDRVYRVLGWEDTKKNLLIGYPRFDLYEDATADSEKYQTFLWMPRWTADSSLEGSTFFQYRDLLMEYFAEHPEQNLIIRPHPLMFRNYVARGLMTQDEVDAFVSTINSSSNISLDEDGDYTKSFKKADVFISDYTSLIAEEIILQKPIIYTGSVANYTSYSKRLAEGYYIVQDEEALLEQLHRLSSGEDEKKDIRKENVNILYNGEKQIIGSKIIDAIKADYFQ